MQRAISILIFIICHFTALPQTTERTELNSLVKAMERVNASHPDSVNWYVSKAMPLAIKYNDISAETRIQTCLAIRAFLKGQFDTAVAIGLNMARKGEKYPPYIELATLYFELSGFYGKSNYHEISGRYVRRGLAITHTLKNDTVLADGYNRLGVYFERDGDLDSALYYYTLSCNINDSLRWYLGKAYSLENIAGIYAQKHDHAKALTFFRRSLAIKRNMNDRMALAIIDINMGEAFAEIKQYDSSIFYTNAAMAIAKEIHFKDLLSYTYKFLSGIYEKRGDDKTSLKYYQLYSDIKDSMYNETRTRQLAEFNTRYETEKKEQQIEKLNHKTTVQSLQLERRNMMLVAGVVIFIVGIIVVWLAYNRYNLKEQAKLQKAISHQQEITAHEVIHAEERERRRIAADLHDGVGQLLSVALMNLNNLFKRTGKAEDAGKLMEHTLSLVTESYDEIRQISHQMIPNTLLKAGLASAVKDMVMRIDQSKLAITLETTGLNERINEEVETVLYRVIQEAVNNVIKHAKATKLNIQLIKDEEGVAVTIEDNGSGFDSKRLKDKGIGLKNMLSRVQFHKGTIDIDSSPHKGTLVAVFIPLL